MTYPDATRRSEDGDKWKINPPKVQEASSRGRSVCAREFLCLLFVKTWRVNFFVPAREEKILRAGTKKISRHFYRKHAPQ
nr:DUF1661 domain-containing protein [Porphyromonas gulae]